MTTREQYYEKIREIRNERLYPDGVPLEEGVEFIHYQGLHRSEKSKCVKTNHVIKCICDKDKEYPYVFTKDHNDLEVHWEDRWSWKGAFKACLFWSNCVVLGKPVSLNDILRLIKDEHFPKIIEQDTMKYVVNFLNVKKIDIDLTKPIKEQALTALYELIK